MKIEDHDLAARIATRWNLALVAHTRLFSAWYNLKENSHTDLGNHNNRPQRQWFIDFDSYFFRCCVIKIYFFKCIPFFFLCVTLLCAELLWLLPLLLCVCISNWIRSSPRAIISASIILTCRHQHTGFLLFLPESFFCCVCFTSCCTPAGLSVDNNSFKRTKCGQGNIKCNSSIHSESREQESN